MKVFKLKWQDWEIEYNYLFLHPDINKTQEQFENDVNSCLLKYGKQYLEQEKSWVGAQNWIKYIIPKLVLDYNYQKIETIDVVYEGFYIIREDELAKYLNPEDTYCKKFGDAIGIELLTEATKKNYLKNYLIERKIK
jgi:hypothetical protein